MDVQTLREWETIAEVMLLRLEMEERVFSVCVAEIGVGLARDGLLGLGVGEEDGYWELLSVNPNHTTKI